MTYFSSHKIRYPWLTAWLVTVVLLLVYNYFFTSLLNSGDDAFLLYTQAGGYGEAPSNLLHYDGILHPAIGFFTSKLFTIAPKTNWYTLLMLAFHWVSLTIIFYTLIKRMSMIMAFLLFSIFFFFIETRQLLSLNVTGTAMLSGTAALGLLFFQLEKGRLKSINSIAAIFLFILSGMLRIQIAWLLIALFLLFFIAVLKRPQLIQWFILMFGISCVLFSLNKIQDWYYKRNISGWERQEAYRQELFYGYNRPIKQQELVKAFKDSSEYQLYFAGFLYDSSRFTTERLKTISRSITRKRLLDEKEDRQGLYWFFMELRIYILLFGVIFTGLWLQKNRRISQKWIWALLSVGGVYAYLFVFMKITTPIHLGLLSVLFLQLAWNFSGKDNFLPVPRVQRSLLSGLLILLFAWMGIRIMEGNQMNRQRLKQFRCAARELNQHPQKLFVATSDVFPMGFFSIWDVPADYPVNNLLYKDRLLTGTYRLTLQRFGITDIQGALFDDENVYLLGPVLPALEKYRKQGITSGRFPGYQCLEVRKLVE